VGLPGDWPIIAEVEGPHFLPRGIPGLDLGCTHAILLTISKCGDTGGDPDP